MFSTPIITIDYWIEGETCRIEIHTGGKPTTVEFNVFSPAAWAGAKRGLEAYHVPTSDIKALTTTVNNKWRYYLTGCGYLSSRWVLAKNSPDLSFNPISVGTIYDAGFAIDAIEDGLFGKGTLFITRLNVWNTMLVGIIVDGDTHRYHDLDDFELDWPQIGGAVRRAYHDHRQDNLQQVQA